MTDQTSSIYNSRNINSLRDEASDVKECFTRFSFQGIIFCSILLGIISKLMIEQPLLGWLSALGILVLMAISKIGIHKYKASNRNYGFQIFASRFDAALHRMPTNLAEEFKNIDHEELMYAWRVIYGTIRKNLYIRYSSRFRGKFNLKDEYKKSNSWIKLSSKFSVNKDRIESTPDKLSRTSANDTIAKIYYDPGSYVRAMQQLFIFLIVAFMGTMIIMNILFWGNVEGKDTVNLFTIRGLEAYSWQLINIAATTLFIVSIIFYAKKHMDERKELEKGINSISTCAMIWGAVSITHIRCTNFVRNNLSISSAQRKEAYKVDTKKTDVSPIKTFFSYDMYNKLLTEETLSLINSLKKDNDIENWISIKISELGNRFYPRFSPKDNSTANLTLFKNGKDCVATIYDANITDISLSGIKLSTDQKFSDAEFDFAVMTIPILENKNISVDVVTYDKTEIRLKFDNLISKNDLDKIRLAA